MSDATLVFAAEETADGATTFSINPDALRTAADAGKTVYYLQKQLAMALAHYGKSDSFASALVEITRGASEEMQRDMEAK